MSHEFQMPDVFVVPPEEDEDPAWCCFNAALPREDRGRNVQDAVPETYFLEDTDLDYAKAIPTANSDTQSVVESCMSRDYNMDHATADSDSDLYYESEYEEDRHNNDAPRTTRNVAEDSDVIEVVKVSRSQRCIENTNHQPPPPPGMKRSTTFKAKATKAFRSISGAFRSSKPRAVDIFPPSRSSSRTSCHPQEDTAERSPPPELRPRSPAARVSRRFSQLFIAPSVKSNGETKVSPDSPPLDLVKSSPSEPSLSTRPSASEQPTFNSCNPLPSSRRTSVYQDTLTSAEELHPRAPSPNESSTRSTNRRFSRVNLQKLFSFSSSQQDLDTQIDPSQQPTVDSGRTTPTLRRKSSSLPSTSSDSSTGPQTPTTTEDVSPVIRLVTKRSSIYDEGVSSPLEFEGFGSGLGILPSESSHSQLSRKDNPPVQETPPLFRRFSSRSYRSSSETTTSVKQVPPPLPQPILPPVLPPAKRQVPSMALEEQVDAGDISFEMRLDSLHFDDLSFDADRFLIEDGR